MGITFREFNVIAIANGLSARECTSEHWQVLGGVRPLNYYPSTGTIYFNGAVHGSYVGSPREAIAMALAGPKKTWGTTRVNMGAKKRRMLARGNARCKWCGCGLTKETATVDHLVPLSRGGSNRMDNLTLACEGCNKRRADEWGAPKGVDTKGEEMAE